MPRKGWKSLSLREEVYNQLEEIAKTHGNSVSQQAEAYLRQAMERDS